MKHYLILILSAISILLIFSELNYQRALQAAKDSEGTDSAIEISMLQYGFNIDAMDNHEPVIGEKIIALLITL